MLKNNFFGQVLIGLMVLFLLVSSVQMFGIGQDLSEVVIDKDNQPKIPSVPKGAKTENTDYKADNKQFYENITGRPMFSETRTAFVPAEPVAEEDPPTEVGELKAKLTGVVITPEQSYAMILDNLTNERVTYKVGMPLEGEQGGWTLTEIHSRKVVFMSDDDKSEELELDIYSGDKKAKGSSKAKGKGKGGKAENKNKAQPEQQSRQDKKKNADDIRKKIAERRAQMRAEAANKNK